MHQQPKARCDAAPAPAAVVSESRSIAGASGIAGASSILFQSDDAAVVLLDVPRSLEECQVLPGQPPAARLYADPPPAAPLPTPEPRSPSGAPQQPPAVRIADLMTAAAVRAALRQLADAYAGPFHLPRCPAPQPSGAAAASLAPPPAAVPPAARFLNGSIADLRQTLLDAAPRFDLVVVDPPWPNRSARRRADKYATATNLAEMRGLLTSIPVPAILAPGGLVAVWTTNKPGIRRLLTSDTGVLAAWGLELAAEWTWLKVTAAGEPLYDVDAVWRKPWERLLIAKPRGSRPPPALAPKVIVAAPDVHSRKPNLRGLFHDFLGQRYVGLEVFARNLTAGWWSWGDEVLKFQEPQYWRSLRHPAE